MDKMCRVMRVNEIFHFDSHDFEEILVYTLEGKVNSGHVTIKIHRKLQEIFELIEKTKEQYKDAEFDYYIQPPVVDSWGSGSDGYLQISMFSEETDQEFEVRKKLELKALEEQRKKQKDKEKKEKELLKELMKKYPEVVKK